MACAMGYGGYSSPLPPLSPGMSAFNALDRNHDGVLSREEFAAAFQGGAGGGFSGCAGGGFSYGGPGFPGPMPAPPPMVNSCCVNPAHASWQHHGTGWYEPRTISTPPSPPLFAYDRYNGRGLSPGFMRSDSHAGWSYGRNLGFERTQLDLRDNVIERSVAVQREVPKFVSRRQVVELRQEVPRTEIQFVEKEIEVPEIQYVEKIVEVPQIQYQEVVIPVPKVEVREVVREVPKLETKYVERHVEVPRVEYVDRVVEVPQVQYVEKIVEVPRTHYEEVVRQVPRFDVREIVREVPRWNVQQVERVVEVPEVQYVERIVEVPQTHVEEVIRHVPRVEIQEHVRHVPKHEVQYVERVVEVPQVRVQERVVEVPQVQYQEVIKHVPREYVQEVLRHVPKVHSQLIERHVEVPHVRYEERHVEVPMVQRVMAAPQHYNYAAPPAPVTTYAAPATTYNAPPAFTAFSDRLCECGTYLMLDSIFCQKCGKRWLGMTAVQQRSLTAPQALSLPSLTTAVLPPHPPVYMATQSFGSYSPMTRSGSYVPSPMGSYVPPVVHGYSVNVPPSFNVYAAPPVQVRHDVGTPSAALAFGKPQSVAGCSYSAPKPAAAPCSYGAPAPAAVHSGRGLQARVLSVSEAYPLQQELTTVPVSTVSGGGDLFSAMDTNHDGVLSREEFNAAMRRAEEAAAKASESSALFARAA